MDYEIIKSAVKSGDLHKVRTLCEQGADESEGGDPEGERRNTLLRLAAWHGHQDVAAYLLDRGADVNTVDPSNQTTPLYTAALWGYTSLASMLIQRGANVNAQDDRDSTPLRRALASYGQSHELPEPHGEEGQRHFEMIQLLLDNGADINAQDAEGFTALHTVEDVNTANFLIDKGADLNIKDNNDMTPLHNAALFNNVQIATLLVQRGADINAKDNAGKTPLEWAQYENHTKIVNLLQNSVPRSYSASPVAQPENLSKGGCVGILVFMLVVAPTITVILIR